MNSNIQSLIQFCKVHSAILVDELGGKQVKLSMNPLITTALWLRIIENFQGIIFLAESKRPINGFIILRSMTEAYFLMRKCIADAEFHKVYSNKFAAEKVKRISRVGKIQEKTGFQFKSGELEGLKKHFESQINQDASLGYTVSELAKELNEVTLYEMVYVHCNLFTHCDAATLDRYLKEGESGPELVVNKNSDEDSILTCLMGASLFLKAFEAYSAFLDHKPINAQKYVTEYNRIHDLIAEEEPLKAPKN